MNLASPAAEACRPHASEKMTKSIFIDLPRVISRDSDEMVGIHQEDINHHAQEEPSLIVVIVPKARSKGTTTLATSNR